MFSPATFGVAVCQGWADTVRPYQKHLIGVNSIPHGCGVRPTIRVDAIRPYKIVRARLARAP